MSEFSNHGMTSRVRHNPHPLYNQKEKHLSLKTCTHEPKAVVQNVLKSRFSVHPGPQTSMSDLNR